MRLLRTTAAPRPVMLPHLVRRILLNVAWTAVLCTLVGVAAAIVRLLPWLVSSDVPTAVSLAFLRPLVMASLEVALLVSLPLGAALEAAHWVADGTACTLRTLGVGPLRQATHTAVAGLAVTLAALAVSTESARVAAAPGDLSNQLIDAAREDACRTNAPSHVPLVEVAWLCTDGTPRLAGHLPRRGPATMVWTAKGARFAPDLGRVALEGVRWTLARPAMSIQVKHVRVSGFVPWLTPGTVAPLLRGVATALASWWTAVACAWGLLRWPSASKARALVVGISGTLGHLLWAGSILRAASWYGLPALGALGVAVPIVVARLTAPGRLPEALTGGRKRSRVGKPATGNPDG